MSERFVSVREAAVALSLTTSEVARLIVSGKLGVDVPSGVPLDVVSVRVLTDSVRVYMADCSAVRNSSLDVSEANRILGRKFSGRNWPPAAYSPHSPYPREVPDDNILSVADCAAVVFDWLVECGEYESKVADIADSVCRRTRHMSRVELEKALVELEALNVVDVVKKQSSSRGPRPRVARLYMWMFNALRDGRRLSIADVRARKNGGVSS